MTLPELTIEQTDSTEIDWNVVARYLANELSAEQRQAFERWIGDDVQRLEWFTELRRLWDQAGTLPSSSRMRVIWQSIVHHIATDATNATGISSEAHSVDVGTVTPSRDAGAADEPPVAAPPSVSRRS